jgi:hypothetical protein
VNETGVRFIHRRGGSREIAELLQAVFVGELLAPSSVLYLISPWISNVPILDNRAHAFVSLEPGWTHGEIRLVEVLERLMDTGCKLVVATRPDKHNVSFLRALGQAGERIGVSPVIHQVEELHEKGILGDAFYLSGSMNLTFNGISINEERIDYHTEESVIAHTRGIYADRWGGGHA